MIQRHEIKAKPNASQRTKNRIRENGPNFRSRSIMQLELNGELNGRRCVLLSSESTTWVGWLPCDEIETEKKE